MARKYNFNAGPSALPLEVLEEAQKNLVDHHGLGLSVLEMSHRTPEFEGILDHAKKTIAKLIGLPETYDVLFLQGGAHLQFSMVPMNLGKGGAYVNTGVWSKKALAEAKVIGAATEIWTDKDNNFRNVPAKGTKFHMPDVPYVHTTSNNTIYGTQWQHTPEVSGTLHVCDMSSDILSRPIEIEKYDLIYAGAQKNAGPSGVTLVIGKKSVLGTFKGEAWVPTFLKYSSHLENNSLYNTPPTFGIYLCSLVFDWIEKMGGLEAIQKRNEEKAGLIYEQIDRRPDLFRGHASKDCRSRMNITFTMPTPEMEKAFLAKAKEAGCIGLKGHRSVGGLRASVYNAVTMEAVQVLADLMAKYEA
jgi:phosphoserine aminotransferase